ncbi:MAG: hypothetical protein PHG16_10520 [Lachnospiraceae bacterium]|nr:hypothetical protein [Lachnospiraceae bacterium]
MRKDDIREIINTELNMIKLDEAIRNKIREKVKEKNSHRLLRSLAACAAVVILGTSTVVAGCYVISRITVNDAALPELEKMDVIKLPKIEGISNTYNRVEKEYPDYCTLKEELGIPLLDSTLSADNPNMLVHLNTDNKDFLMVTIDNFIPGDTSNYQYIAEESRYSYEHGTLYYSPVSLSIDIMLSETQQSNGWNTDYLGMYQFVENYTSSQGYRVNFIEDTSDTSISENVPSEKCAILVANGIRYTFKGRVSLATMKSLIDTLEYL